MKKIIIIITTVSLITLFACGRKINRTVTVERNCTGTYLLLNEKKYKVCNTEKVEQFHDGETVRATFTKLKECDGSGNNGIFCEMAFPFECWIEIVKIR
jgi:hypothetical protein